MKLDTPNGLITVNGECLDSKLKWSKDIEKRIHLNNGLYTTKQIPTDCFIETWNINGEITKIMKLVANGKSSYSLIQ